MGRIIRFRFCCTSRSRCSLPLLPVTCHIVQASTSTGKHHITASQVGRRCVLGSSSACSLRDLFPGCSAPVLACPAVPDWQCAVSHPVDHRSSEGTKAGHQHGMCLAVLWHCAPLTVVQGRQGGSSTVAASGSPQYIWRVPFKACSCE